MSSEAKVLPREGSPAGSSVQAAVNPVLLVMFITFQAN